MNEVSNLITGQQFTQLATNGRNMVTTHHAGDGGFLGNIGRFNGVTAQGSGFGLSFTACARTITTG